MFDCKKKLTQSSSNFPGKQNDIVIQSTGTEGRKVQVFKRRCMHVTFVYGGGRETRLCKAIQHVTYPPIQSGKEFIIKYLEPLYGVIKLFVNLFQFISCIYVTAITCFMDYLLVNSFCFTGRQAAILEDVSARKKKYLIETEYSNRTRV
jgi:hypothetical protein